MSREMGSSKEWGVECGAQSPMTCGGDSERVPCISAEPSGRSLEEEEGKKKKKKKRACNSTLVLVAFFWQHVSHCVLVSQEATGVAEGRSSLFVYGVQFSHAEHYCFSNMSEYCFWCRRRPLA